MLLLVDGNVLAVLLAVFAFTSIVFFVNAGRSSKPPRATSNAGASKGPRTYTLDEIKKHKSRNDCWIIVKDKVYDVTSYVEEHPGGDAILKNAGGDSTEGFMGPQHVTRVFQMIDDFYIGDVAL